MSNLTDARAELEAALTIALGFRSDKAEALRQATLGASKQTRLAAERALAAAESVVTAIQSAQADLAQVI